MSLDVSMSARAETRCSSSARPRGVGDVERLLGTPRTQQEQCLIRVDLRLTRGVRRSQLARTVVPSNALHGRDGLAPSGDRRVQRPEASKCPGAQRQRFGRRVRAGECERRPRRVQYTRRSCPLSSGRSDARFGECHKPARELGLETRRDRVSPTQLRLRVARAPGPLRDLGQQETVEQLRVREPRAMDLERIAGKLRREREAPRQRVDRACRGGRPHAPPAGLTSRSPSALGRNIRARGDRRERPRRSRP